MRSSRSASVGVVTKLVDMKCSLAIGIVATEVPGDFRRGTFVELLKGDGAEDGGITSDSSNCTSRYDFSHLRARTIV
jgi:hypothetical protein